MAPVARQGQTGDDDDGRTHDRKPYDEVPRRRRVPERVRQVVPQPVLEVVDEREEERGDERCGNPDRRAEEHEAEICPPFQATKAWRPLPAPALRPCRRAAGDVGKRLGGCGRQADGPPAGAAGVVVGCGGGHDHAPSLRRRPVTRARRGLLYARRVSRTSPHDRSIGPTRARPAR